MSIPQPQPPHQSLPPPSSSRHGTSNVPEGSGGLEDEEEEKAAQIDEILRLERSMNGALRASRDEMESLKDSAAEKRAAIKKMEEEIMAAMQQMGTNAGDGASSSGKSPEPRRLQRRHSSGLSVCSTRSTWSSSSKVSTATGGRPDRRASMKRETSLRRSFLQQNVFSRRVSVTGDSPFFRRPTLQDAEIERKENSRRRSDPPAAQPAGALRRSTSFTSSRLGEEGSRESGNNSGGHLRTLSTDDPESQSSDDSDNGKPGSVNKEELKRLRKTLRGKEGELDALRRRHQSNQNQLSYLQTKLHSIETKAMARREEHKATVEALQRRKEVLARDIRRKERLTGEVERCVGLHNSRIAELEQVIESKKLVLRKGQDKQIESETNDEGTNSTASLMEEEMRKHQLRLRIHSQYTAKAIESFLKCLKSAKEKDVDGLLLGLDNSWHAGEADEEEEARRQLLVEEIALDVDTQLNNLDRRIKEAGDKVEEYKVLSSSEQLAEACERDHAKDGADGSGHNEENDTEAFPRQPNKLLPLTKECANLLEDLISTISRTMESTVRATPHSLSIEFQPSESDARISEDATSPSNATENAPPSNTSMSSNAEDERSLHTEEETSEYLDILSDQQNQLRVTTERLEDDGLSGLVKAGTAMRKRL